MSALGQNDLREVENPMTQARTTIGTIIALAILIIGGATFLLVGGYNVAATAPHSALTAWILHTTMERSVSARAKSITAPAQFIQEQIREGALDFGEMCVECHGAPGKERGEVGKGLNPSPPDLVHAVSHWSSAELFWIVKNGLKMTGMPAFGATHSDDRLWSIIAFVQQLPKLTPEDYKKIEHSGDGHSHIHQDMHDHQH